MTENLYELTSFTIYLLHKEVTNNCPRKLMSLTISRFGGNLPRYHWQIASLLSHALLWV